MGVMLVDSHTHLLRLEVSPERAVRSAAEVGVVAVVNVGTDVEDSQRGAELAAVLPNVYSTAGIHPHNAGTYTAADLEVLAELSESPGIVALGEVGLDYYRSEWSISTPAKPSPIRWPAWGAPGFLSSCTASRVATARSGKRGNAATTSASRAT
jgi:Tat protein secretion system quality control protein TatD with DNase activity